MVRVPQRLLAALLLCVGLVGHGMALLLDGRDDEARVVHAEVLLYGMSANDSQLALDSGANYVTVLKAPRLVCRS